jgi:hypothetical protein
MRLLMLPLLAIGLTAVDQPSEPGETAMRAAFEAKLRAQVASALDFVAETAGPDGVARIKAAGTDRFQVQGFRKLDCHRDEMGYVCNFAVDVSVTNGLIQHTLKGRFEQGPGGSLTFAQES